MDFPQVYTSPGERECSSSPPLTYPNPTQTLVSTPSNAPLLKLSANIFCHLTIALLLSAHSKKRRKEIFCTRKVSDEYAMAYARLDSWRLKTSVILLLLLSCMFSNSPAPWQNRSNRSSKYVSALIAARCLDCHYFLRSCFSAMGGHLSGPHTRAVFQRTNLRTR